MHIVLQKPPTFSEASDKYGNKITEYPKSALYVQTIERDVVGGLLNPAWETAIDYNGTDLWLQKRKSRLASLDTAITLRLKVNGNTTLQIGDMVGVVLKNQTDTDSAQDPYLTGRYLVTKLRHEFTKDAGKNTHTLHLDCVRDTVQKAYPSSGIAIEDGGNSTEELIPRGSSDPGDVAF